MFPQWYDRCGGPNFARTQTARTQKASSLAYPLAAAQRAIPESTRQLWNPSFLLLIFHAEMYPLALPDLLEILTALEFIPLILKPQVVPPSFPISPLLEWPPFAHPFKLWVFPKV